MIITVKGKVVEGKHIGSTLGFPTANIAPEGEYSLPGNGVYAARIWIAGCENALMCVLNQGRHPTLPEGAPTIEAHILDFSGDIYGADVTVEYVEFLRGEVRFPGIEALKSQISKDIEKARKIL